MGEVLSAFELRALEAVILYQLGVEVRLEGASLNVRGVRSRRTSRLKQILLDGKPVITIRANDGFVVPKRDGWEFLARHSDDKRLPCVIVPGDVARFVAEGRTLFSKHVIKAEGEIYPGDEICIKSDNGEIVGSGKALLPGWEMGRIKRGKAVRTR
ncbi:hypothetical protein IG193_04225 [Infirmifilum lucidum]|uniref:PUA domain-containing protein n=1 Tax=Infirmifilum lucidum TaxID=2776706 RepID=A0A7L9FLB4_9CREN|nr:PUA domain-containing protein [Infirmifilum lucidum]QOJ79666.1 hypothetical protein IG193_04225 [Infirmifilum lucidum]